MSLEKAAIEKGKNVPSVVVSGTSEDKPINDQEIEEDQLVEFDPPTLASDPIMIRSTKSLLKQAREMTRLTFEAVQHELSAEEGLEIELLFITG